MPDTDIAALYAGHLAETCRRSDEALAAAGRDHLLVAAGVEKYGFLDDTPYPFRANPHFLAWVPLQHHPHSWIAYTPGKRPLLAYYQPDDYWHLPPTDPSGWWVEHFDVRVIREPGEAARLLPAASASAILGEADAALPGHAPDNPAAVLDRLHWHRARKTPYELALMRRSQRRAVPGHRAAEAAFRAGGSELDIHRAYLQSTGHSDVDLPYGNIVALNEHGATLHYQYRDASAPAQNRSLLIDAGATVAGYATDITRTWGNGDASFEALIDAVDAVQLRLVDQVRAGRDYRDLHVDAHRLLGGVLRDAGVLRIDADSAVERGVTSTFFPHGLGHLLGLQVHDIGGFQAAPSGGTRPKPEGHPFLRLTRSLEPGMVTTIEPGVYFIDTLLQKLRASPNADAVDWAAVERFRPFGGVRIEDDVACTDGAPENLSRDAFAES